MEIERGKSRDRHEERREICKVYCLWFFCVILLSMFLWDEWVRNFLGVGVGRGLVDVDLSSCLVISFVEMR